MSGKAYSFSVDDANKYGVDSAILLYNFRYWLDYSMAHNQNEHDGYYWLYATAKGLSELFPFWSSNKIQKTLKQLEEAGVIICGEFNNNKFNRTKWYTMDGYQSQPNGGLRASQTDECTISQTADSPYVNKDSNNIKNTCHFASEHDERMSLGKGKKEQENYVEKYFDSERIIKLWNSFGCKQHKGLTQSAKQSLAKTYFVYAKEKGDEAKDLNDWLETYLKKGFAEKFMTNHHREMNDGQWAADLEFAVRFSTYDKVRNTK